MVPTALTSRIAALTLALFPVLLQGCNAGSAAPSAFLPEDESALQAICQAPPYPVSFSGLRNQAAGHLRQVLDRRRYLSAQEYWELLGSNDGAALNDRAALIVMEHRDSHIAAGCLLVLFNVTGTQDIFQAELMLEDPDNFSEGLVLRDTYAFNWYQTDGDSDFVQDELFIMDLSARAELVDSAGQPMYVFRWGEP